MAAKYVIQNQEIRFEVTNKCNAACIMCPREKHTRPQGILDMDLYIRVLDEAFDMGARIVNLENYGETFIDPYFFDRAAYAKGKGMKVYTVTTGSLLNPRLAELCLYFIDKIRFSFYGTTKEVYEKIHVGLKYEMSLGNIEHLLSIKKKKNKKSPRIEVYFLMLPENEHQVEEFKKRWQGAVDHISIWKPHNWGDGRGYRSIHQSQPKVTCGRPRRGPVQIQWDGRVVPCCYDYNSTIVLGDLNTHSLYEVLTGKGYEDFRKAHDVGSFHLYPYCDNCDQLQKREDVLVYSTIEQSRVGALNSTYIQLD